MLKSNLIQLLILWACVVLILVGARLKLFALFISILCGWVLLVALQFYWGETETREDVMYLIFWCILHTAFCTLNWLALSLARRVFRH